MDLCKSGLEECEMAWLEAQEQLEQMLLEGQRPDIFIFLCVHGM